MKTMKNFTEGVLNVDELPEDGLMQQIMNVRARNADIQLRSAEKANLKG